MFLFFFLLLFKSDAKNNGVTKSSNNDEEVVICSREVKDCSTFSTKSLSFTAHYLNEGETFSMILNRIALKDIITVVLSNGEDLLIDFRNNRNYILSGLSLNVITAPSNSNTNPSSNLLINFDLRQIDKIQIKSTLVTLKCDSLYYINDVTLNDTGASVIMRGAVRADTLSIVKDSLNLKAEKIMLSHKLLLLGSQAYNINDFQNLRIFTQLIDNENYQLYISYISSSEYDTNTKLPNVEFNFNFSSYVVINFESFDKYNYLKSNSNEVNWLNDSADNNRYPTFSFVNNYRNVKNINNKKDVTFIFEPSNVIVCLTNKVKQSSGIKTYYLYQNPIFSNVDVSITDLKFNIANNNLVMYVTDLKKLQEAFNTITELSRGVIVQTISIYVDPLILNLDFSSIPKCNNFFFVNAGFFNFKTNLKVTPNVVFPAVTVRDLELEVYISTSNFDRPNDEDQGGGDFTPMAKFTSLCLISSKITGPIHVIKVMTDIEGIDNYKGITIDTLLLEYAINDKNMCYELYFIENGWTFKEYLIRNNNNNKNIFNINNYNNNYNNSNYDNNVNNENNVNVKANDLIPMSSTTATINPLSFNIKYVFAFSFRCSVCLNMTISLVDPTKSVKSLFANYLVISEGNMEETETNKTPMPKASIKFDDSWKDNKIKDLTFKIDSKDNNFNFDYRSMCDNMVLYNIRTAQSFGRNGLIDPNAPNIPTENQSLISDIGTNDDKTVPNKGEGIVKTPTKDRNKTRNDVLIGTSVAGVIVVIVLAVLIYLVMKKKKVKVYQQSSEEDEQTA